MIRRISRLEAGTLLLHLASAARLADRRKATEHQGWHPWTLVTLVRWTLEHARLAPPFRPAELSDVEGMLRELHELTGWSPFWDTSARGIPQKWSRLTAIQQFWSQEDLGAADFARPVLWFERLSKKGALDQIMRARFGFGARALSEVLFAVWSWARAAGSNALLLEVSNLRSFGVSDELVRLVLDHLSFGQDTMKPLLETDSQRVRRPALQLFDFRPMIRRPLVRVQDAYLVYSLKLLEESLRSIHVRLVREAAGSDAGTQLGTVVERHVELGLRTAGFKFLREAALRRRSNDSEMKVADFGIFFDDALVLLEAKATEYRQITAVLPESELLRGDLESSYVKAVKQAYTC